MGSHRGIRSRRRHRLIHKDFELQLTSLLDVLVIIVVFLLKSYNTSTNSLTMARGLQLPFSSSPDSPPETLQVVVTPESLTLDNERVLDFKQSPVHLGEGQVQVEFREGDLDEGKRRIVPLYDALVKARERTEVLLSKSKARLDGKPIPFEGTLAIQADKRIQYQTIRKIMYTAATAGFKTFRFLAAKRET